MEPYYQDKQITIYHGDCFEILPDIVHADLVLTDPPYMIGATSMGDSASKNGSWADLMNSAFWYAHMLRLAKDRIHNHGFILMFGNWRSIPVYNKAFLDAGLIPSNCIVWDKEWIGPASKKQLRPLYEIIYVAAGPTAGIKNRSAKDIMRCKWMAGHSKTTQHPAEKPVSLLYELIKTFDAKSIIDPFMGSGTTLRAAKQTGSKAIGIEVEEKWCEAAANSLRQECLFAI